MDGWMDGCGGVIRSFDFSQTYLYQIILLLEIIVISSNISSSILGIMCSNIRCTSGGRNQRGTQ